MLSVQPLSPYSRLGCALQGGTLGGSVVGAVHGATVWVCNLQCRASAQHAALAQVALLGRALWWCVGCRVVCLCVLL